MARDEGAGAGTVIVAFVLGAIAGAAAALLVAPATGEETRRTLGEKAREARERAEAAAKESKEFLHRQRETVASAIERGREAYEQARGGTAPGAAGAPEAS